MTEPYKIKSAATNGCGVVIEVVLTRFNQRNDHPVAIALYLVVGTF